MWPWNFSRNRPSRRSPTRLPILCSGHWLHLRLPPSCCDSVGSLNVKASNVLAPRLHLAAMPLRSRLASPHIAQLASKVRISALARPRPIAPFPPLRRPFSTSPLLRNTQPPPLPPFPLPFPPPVPPKPSLIRRLFRPLRHLKYLRYLPYKTILFIFVVFWAFESVDNYFKDNIQAIRTQFTVPENTWLYLNLNDLHIVDSPHSERALQVVPFVSSAGKRRMTMLELTTSIQDAAMDPKVRGLVLSFNDSIAEHRSVLTGEVIESSLGYGKMEELQAAIDKFARAKQVQHKLLQMKFDFVEKIQKKFGPAFLEKLRKGEVTLGPEDFETEELNGMLEGGDAKPADPNREVLFDLSKECVIAISDNYSTFSLWGWANSRCSELRSGECCAQDLYATIWRNQFDGVVHGSICKPSFSSDRV
jgi:hypothetical protein